MLDMSTANPVPLQTTTAPKRTPRQPAKVVRFLNLKKQYNLLQPGDVSELARKMRAVEHSIIPGFLPRASVNILVGDSGIGKSPFVYQLAMAAAAGTPEGASFLGMPVRQSRVLFLDYENPVIESERMMERLRRHLNLAKVPWRLVLWPLSQDPAGLLTSEIEEVIFKMQADLVIFDSLRSFCPEMETTKNAITKIKEFRTIAANYGTCFLL